MIDNVLEYEEVCRLWGDRLTDVTVEKKTLNYQDSRSPEHTCTPTLPNKSALLAEWLCASLRFKSFCATCNKRKIIT